MVDQAERTSGDMDPGFPLRAGWEPPTAEDELGHSESTATPLWPGNCFEPVPGWSGDAREVYVQGNDVLPARYRRRHVVRYRTVREAERAFGAASLAVQGHPVVEPGSDGERWYIAATTTRAAGCDELSLLRWSRAGSSTFRIVRDGRALLLSSDSLRGGGHDAALALGEADRRGLAPAIEALKALGRLN